MQKKYPNSVLTLHTDGCVSLHFCRQLCVNSTLRENILHTEAYILSHTLTSLKPDQKILKYLDKEARKNTQTQY